MYIVLKRLALYYRNITVLVYRLQQEVFNNLAKGQESTCLRVLKKLTA
jgi:hypothetical protein